MAGAIVPRENAAIIVNRYKAMRFKICEPSNGGVHAGRTQLRYTHAIDEKLAYSARVQRLVGGVLHEDW
jgi:hypothetical protein